MTFSGEEYWQPEDLTGQRPDVDDVAFGSPAMRERWRGELRNAERQLAQTEVELERATDSPDAYGPAHLERLTRRAATWRILISDYGRYLAGDLAPGPDFHPDDGALF